MKLNQVLNEIVNKRKIHQHYRKLAESWLEIIERPSRHYRKPNGEDLEIPGEN